MSSNYQYLAASNGSGDTPLIHVTSNRTLGSTSFTVDSVTNVPPFFIGTVGTLLASNFIDPSTATNFYGHISGASLVIDAYCPGSVDSGNTSGQVIVVKPTTQWANLVAQFIMNATGNGTPEAHTVAALTASGLITANAGLTVNSGPVSLPASTVNARALTNPYKFSVYRSSTWTATAGTNTMISLDGINFDTNGNWNTTTGYNVPYSGFYFFTGGVGFSSVNGAWTYAYLFKNGGTALAGNGLREGSGGVNTTNTVSGLLQLAAGDQIQLGYFSDSVVTGQNSPTSTFLQGFLVSTI